VGRLLTQLLGRKVTVKRAAAPKPPAALSAYTAPDGQLAAACGFDLEFANYAAAALPMMPCAIATEAIRGKKIEAEMLENLREVANIMAGLFKSAASHLKLRELAKTPAPGADLVALTGKPVRRLDLDVDITGYGLGRLSLFFAAPPATN
jgi:hypothetical protein